MKRIVFSFVVSVCLIANAAVTINHMNVADLQAPINSHLEGGYAQHKIHFWDAASGNVLAPFSSWAVSTFAGGLNPSGTTYNAVRPGGSSGGTSAHLGNGEVGFFLNGFDTPFKPNQNYWSMSFGDVPHNGSTRPWAGTNDFHYAYKQNFGTIYMPSEVCGYTYLGMFLQDTTTGQVINFLVNDWDSRPNINFQHSDYADIAMIQNPDGSLDGVIPYVRATLGYSAMVESYGTPASRGNVQGQTIQRYGTITQQNMKNMIAKFKSLSSRAIQYTNLANKEYQQHGNTKTYRLYIGLANALNQFNSISNNPGDYKILSFGLQAELANTSNTWRKFANGQVGVTYKDVNFVTWIN